MCRFAVRAFKKVNALVVLPDARERRVELENIGLGGAMLVPNDRKSSTWFSPGSVHSLKISLDGIGDLHVGSKVVHCNAGVGLRFSHATQGDLIKIWQFIREDLRNASMCPYCNRSISAAADACSGCGWKLDFDDPNYFSYWERESLLRSLSESLECLSVEKLRWVFRCIESQLPSLSRPADVEDTEEFVGTCDAMKKVFSLIRKVGPTDLPVLVLGESGTGKELTARAIHERSNRSEGPFVPINCAAIPEHLLESELFGHRKGAFTGAHQDKKGKFELAHRGTLFLDEIGEIPINLQPKLLRFLETQQIESLGGRNRTTVDVRIVTATNRDLDEAVSDGTFRTDLYFRIKVFTINLPPLRERGDDITIMANYFLRRIKGERDWPCKGFSPEALQAMQTHQWPGNVRELINRIRRAIVIQNDWIQPGDLELVSRRKSISKQRLRTAKDRAKKEMILEALKEHQFNMTRAAKSLGISRQHLYVLKKKLGISSTRNH